MEKNPSYFIDTYINGKMTSKETIDKLTKEGRKEARKEGRKEARKEGYNIKQRKRRVNS